MDELTQPTIKPARRLLKGIAKVILVLTVLAGLVFAISLLLRSEWFLRHRIDPELERLGSKLHGTFEYESVAPEGMTGIRVEGLRFTPDYDFEGEAVEPIAIDTLIVYPNLSAMLTGDIEPDRVEIEGLHAEFLLDGGPTNRGHWPWLEGVVDDWRQRSGKISSGGGGGGGGGPSPQLVVRDSRIKVRSPGGTMPEVGLSLDEVLIEKVNGEFKLDGGIHVDGLGYALLSGDANHMTRQGGVVVKLVDKPDLLAIAPQRDRVKEVVGADTKLELGGLSVQWPPSVTIYDLKLTDTHIGVPGQDAAYVEEIGAERIHLAFLEHGAQVKFSELDASVRLALVEQFSTQVPIHLPSFDLAIDFAQRLIGAGFEVGEPDSHLKLNAALDLNALDLALAIEARNYDAGPMLNFIPYTGPITASAGIIDGQVSIRYPLREGLVRANTDLAIRGFDFEAPWLAEGLLEDGQFDVRLNALIDVYREELSLEESTLGIGDSDFQLEAKVQRVGVGRHVALQAKLEGQAIDGANLLAALPRGFAPALEGMQLKGAFQAALELELDTREPSALKIEHDFSVDSLEVLAFGPRADIPMLAKDDFAVRVSTAKSEALIGPTQANWTPYYRLPRHIPLSLVASEDGRFYSHSGLDPRAIVSSVIANLEAGSFVRGGSTITQQVAKNLFLSQQKTLARKLQEAFLAWQLEEQLSKQRIIEIYANLVHWGPDIYGIKAAARYYFRKRPTQLTIREMLFLASILPNPEFFGKQYTEGFIRADRLDKMRTVLLGLYHRRVIDWAGYKHHLEKLNRAAISVAPLPEWPRPEAPVEAHKRASL